jgi:hypothetical protein
MNQDFLLPSIDNAMPWIIALPLIILHTQKALLSDIKQETFDGCSLKNK